MLTANLRFCTPGFYDTPDMDYTNTKNSPSVEQTVFIILASVAGLAFILIISLLLCKFQCTVFPLQLQQC